MVFSSVYFLFLFLPLVLLVYYIVPWRFRNLVLLAASLLFYAWGEGFYVLIMIVSIVSNHVLGIWINRNHKRLTPGTVLLIAVLVNLGLLGFFKYANFFMDNMNFLINTLGFDPVQYTRVHLPIGISFFTFQSLSYVIDVYRKEVPPQDRFINTALYISSFPQLIAGPIIRYHDVATQLIERYTTVEKFALGVRRFIVGLGKKVLIANTVALCTDKIFDIPPDQLTTPLAWIGVFCFWLQIYFDFSGYSDMAIGLGHMFGFTFRENFNYPNISQSVREYWVRWHISLTSWIRDYIYFPLGGNKISVPRTYFNLLIIFVITGLWHGASWTFVIWGLWNGMFMALERRIIQIDKVPFVPLRWLYMFMALIPGYVMFRAETVGYAFPYLGAMYGFAQGTGAGHSINFYVQLDTILAMAFGFIGGAPILPYIDRKIRGAFEKYRGRGVLIMERMYPAVQILLLVVILGLSILKLSAGSYNPFIYFRF